MEINLDEYVNTTLEPNESEFVPDILQSIVFSYISLYNRLVTSVEDSPDSEDMIIKKSVYEDLTTSLFEFIQHLASTAGLEIEENKGDVDA